MASCPRCRPSQAVAAVANAPMVRTDEKRSVVCLHVIVITLAHPVSRLFLILAEHCVRTEPAKHLTNGFFVAVFERSTPPQPPAKRTKFQPEPTDKDKTKNKTKNKAKDEDKPKATAKAAARTAEQASVVHSTAAASVPVIGAARRKQKRGPRYNNKVPRSVTFTKRR